MAYRQSRDLGTLYDEGIRVYAVQDDDSENSSRGRPSRLNNLRRDPPAEHRPRHDGQNHPRANRRNSLIDPESRNSAPIINHYPAGHYNYDNRPQNFYPPYPPYPNNGYPIPPPAPPPPPPPPYPMYQGGFGTGAPPAHPNNYSLGPPWQYSVPNQTPQNHNPIISGFQNQIGHEPFQPRHRRKSSSNGSAVSDAPPTSPLEERLEKAERQLRKFRRENHKARLKEEVLADARRQVDADMTRILRETSFRADSNQAEAGFDMRHVPRAVRIINEPSRPRKQESRGTRTRVIDEDGYVLGYLS